MILVPQHTNQALASLAGILSTLARAEALGAPPGGFDQALARLSLIVLELRGELPVALPRRKRAPTKLKKNRTKKPPTPRLVEEVVFEEPPPSDWDPDDDLADAIEASRCRALLLEILRRAIHDWVLYRSHTRLAEREKAQSAYTWLFEEGPGHPWWAIRQRDGQMLTALLTICEIFDFDVEYVRRAARETTVHKILTAGRPPETRKAAKDVHYTEYEVDAPSGYVDALDGPRGSFSDDHSYIPDYY